MTCGPKVQLFPKAKPKREVQSNDPWGKKTRAEPSGYAP